MHMRVTAELIDSDGKAILGFNREEMVYLDIGVDADDEAGARAWSAEVEDAGSTLLDWLDEARQKVGKQAARLSGGISR